MIPWEDNLGKHTKSSVTLDSLLVDTGYTLEQSISEYEYVMDKIKTAIAQKLPVSGAYILEQLHEAKLHKKL